MSLSREQKARIRKIERRFYVVAETALLISLLAMFYTAAMGSVLAKSFVKITLARTSSSMFDAYLLYEKDKLRELAAMKPPGCSCEREAWARDVQKHLDQPAAVFVREGGEIAWVLKADSLTKQMDRVAGLFTPGSDSTGKTDTLGNMRLRHVYLIPQNSFDGNVWIYGAADNDLRWGILFRFQDGWKPFLNGLERAKTHIELEDAAAYAKNCIQLEPPLKLGTDRTCMRASVNGEALFRSPGLDTTKRSGDVVLPYIKLEFFLSDMDAVYAKTMGDTSLPWGKAVIFLCFMAMIYRVHRWVWELTDDATTETN